jgi:adenine phosphoribosyltransferase
MALANYIRDIQGFPKEGVLFKDITPLLIDPKATKECLEILVSSLKDKKTDKGIGLESRGFFFGMLIAQKLNVGFVAVRKPDKLPYDTIFASDELE